MTNQADKCLEKLQEKNQLEDELTGALEMHESQQNEIACLFNMQQAQQQVIEEREATNDRSESAIGGTMHQLQKYSHIGITNAAAVSDA